MFKRLILITSLCFSFAFAQISQAQAISAIKANPSLLNTPQAQAEMSNIGISKSEVLSKLRAKDIGSKTKVTAKKANNKITLSEKVVDVKNTKKAYNKNPVYINPFQYKQNSILLQELKAEQSIKHRANLKRFGISFFKNRNNLNTSSLPTPSYYVLSYGDIISIWIYGAKNDNFLLKIDNNGDINIPKYGPLHIAGLQFGEAKNYIKKRLKKVYENANIAVNIANYSTIQVNLVGDVVAPGVYNVNALSSVKNLLILAHGVKANGSLRNVLIKRDGKLLASIDFYKLLLNGDEGMNIILRSNDTVLVPKAKKIVSIDGQVNDPAKFELNSSDTLANLIKYAGGIKANASRYGLIVERYANHKILKTISVDLKNVKRFKLLNDDKVYVYSIDKIHKKSIYFYGNVVRPGEKELGKDKSLRDFLQNKISKLSLKGVFLKDTLFSYALLKRKTADLGTKVINFNLAKVLNGASDIKLKNNDEIYIFNKYNSNVVPYITISGTPVIKPGKYRYYKNIKIKDLIEMAGTTSYYNNLSEVKITTFHTKNFMPKTIILKGKMIQNYKLHPFDQIEIYDYYKLHPIKTVNIYGQVNLPNKYPLNANMTLKQAIYLAGGFTPKAYKKDIEIIRYYIKDNKRKTKIIEVPFYNINRFVLKDYDEINVHTIPDWGKRKTVTVKGQVNFPGTYVIESGEKLASIIQRAGGYTKNAFLNGVVFTRESIRKLQRKRMKQAILELKQKAIALSVNPSQLGQGDKKINLVNVTNMIDKITTEAENLEPIGRISVHLERNLKDFKNSKSNIVLKNKDTIIIPSTNDTILVVGQVMSPTAIVYESNDVSYYIEKAGGLSQRADSDAMFVVHADGSAQKVKSGWFSDSSTHIVRRGDTIVVPQKLIHYTGMQLTKDLSSIFYKFALTIAAMHTVGAL